jgi:hypothetical protein
LAQAGDVNFLSVVAAHSVTVHSATSIPIENTIKGRNCDELGCHTRVTSGMGWLMSDYTPDDTHRIGWAVVTRKK